MASPVVAGAAFGAALVVSGVYQPTVILGQLKWENYHMLQAFLAATASTAVVTTAAARLHIASFQPRAYADRGWFAPYDGNLVGGLLLGAGMALTGACPGTVLVQTALGIRSGYYALAGGVAGGVLWTLLKPRLGSKTAPMSDATSSTPTSPLPTTVQDLLGVSPGAALIGVEALFAAVVAGAAALFGPGPHASITSPVLGGLLIGLAQLASVLLRKRLVGVSAVYDDVGAWLLYAVRKTKETKTPSTALPPSTPGVQSILFAAGLMAGARATAAATPAATAAAVTAAATATTSPPAVALLGGVAIALGALAAGGCPSGHGISGMSQLSLSSFITIGAAFVGGGLVALLL